MGELRENIVFKMSIAFLLFPFENRECHVIIMGSPGK